MNPKTEQALRTVRILRISFIGAGLMFLDLVFKLPPNGVALSQPAIELIPAALALTNVVLGFLLPGFLERAALRSQSSARQSITPIQRWFSGCVLSLALFQSCNLFGLMLHFLGARVLVFGSLFAAGLLAMAFWSPGAPPNDEGTSPTQLFPGA